MAMLQSRAKKVELNRRSRSKNSAGHGCDDKIFGKFSDLAVCQITLPGMTSVEFNNALEKYVKKIASICYDAAIYTYDGENMVVQKHPEID
jgi:hypothetical protein